MKWLRIGLWTVGGLLALAAAAALIVTQLVDPNRFRADIESAVANATGRTLSIHGELDLGWFPWLAIVTRDAEIASAEPASAESATAGARVPLAHWREARVGARLLPLLRGRLEIDTIRIDGLTVNLVRDAAGRGNWATPAQSGPAAASQRQLVAIEGIDLRDATLSFADLARNSRWQVCGVDVESSRLAAGVPIELSGQVRLQASENCDGGIPVRWSLRYQPAGKSHELRDVSIQRSDGALALAIPALAIDAALQNATARSWSLRAARGGVSGGPLRIALSPTVSVVSALTLEQLDLRAALAAAGIELPRTQDAKVLGSVSGAAELEWRGDGARFESAGLQLDDTRLHGSVSRAGGGDAPWQFDWQLDEIRLERYLPPRDPQQPPFKFPSEWLQSLSAQGRLRIGTLRWLDVTARDAVLRLELEDGELRSLPVATTAAP